MKRFSTDCGSDVDRALLNNFQKLKEKNGLKNALKRKLAVYIPECFVTGTSDNALAIGARGQIQYAIGVSGQLGHLE